MKKSILEVVHESAKGLFDIGLMDAKTMHTFDAMCLPPDNPVEYFRKCQHEQEIHQS